VPGLSPTNFSCKRRKGKKEEMVSITHLVKMERSKLPCVHSQDKLIEECHTPVSSRMTEVALEAP
jgi:hypothetical protein